MEETLLAYNGEFSVEERKKMTAEAIQELRKSKRMSQKEVAGYLGIPATTYNTYESGRTEPPIEYLVRLSHLYGIPVDIIVQRDRTYKTGDDIRKIALSFKDELASLDKKLADEGKGTEVTTELMKSLNKLANALEGYTKTEAVQKALSTNKE